MSEEKNAISDFLSNMSAFFRYLIPGLVTLFLIKRYFVCGDFIFDLLQTEDGSYNWYGVTLVAICLGAIITVLNRYIVMSIEDIAWYYLRENGTVHKWKYISNLTEFLKKRFEVKKEFFDHCYLRRSQCHFLCFLSEVALCISLCENNLWFLLPFFILFFMYLANSFIAFCIEKDKVGL